MNERLKVMSSEIETLKRNLREDDELIRENHMYLSKVMADRNELLAKLDHLQVRYEECVRDINKDRGEMERHNM